MTSLRPVIIDKYGLTPDMLTHDLRVSQRTAAAVCRPDVRDLVPGEADVVSEDDSAPCLTGHTPRDVRDPDGDIAMSQGSWSSSEDTSAVASGTDDGEQDQELFLEASRGTPLSLPLTHYWMCCSFAFFPVILTPSLPHSLMKVISYAWA